MVLSLLALAIAPGIAIIFFIYSKDKYDREPLKNLVVSFVLGMASVIPAYIIQVNSQPFLSKYFPAYSVSYFSVLAFIIVAFSEELSKFLMLRVYAYPHKEFNEPFDGIIYSVMIGMGFATVENISYVMQHGFMTGVIRMFLSVPAHGAFAVLMGYHVGVGKFRHNHQWFHLTKGLLLAVFFHGAFDFFLFLQDSPEVKKFVSNALLICGALISYWVAIRISLRSIRLHQKLSHENFEAQQNNVIV